MINCKKKIIVSGVFDLQELNWALTFIILIQVQKQLCQKYSAHKPWNIDVWFAESGRAMFLYRSTSWICCKISHSYKHDNTKSDHHFSGTFQGILDEENNEL